MSEKTVDTNSKEFKDAVAAAVAAATEKLEAKRSELLEEAKAAKAAKKAAEDELAKVADRVAELEDAVNGKETDAGKKAEREMAKLQKQLETLTAEREAARSNLSRVLVENGITEALTKANVGPAYLEAARALLLSKHKAEIAEGEAGPKATIDGKPLAEFVNEWSGSDAGKHFVSAASSGGGSAGGANRGGSAPSGRKRSEMSVEEKSAFVAEHGQAKYLELPF